MFEIWLQFRQGAIATLADIEAILKQNEVRQPDRRLLQFMLNQPRKQETTTGFLMGKEAQHLYIKPRQEIRAAL